MDQIRLGYPDIALHEAAAACVARVLEAHEIEVVPAPLDAEARVGGDDADLFACAWLPGAASPEAGLRTLGLLYRPQLVWCVPNLADAPPGIGSLARAPQDFDRRIQAPRGFADAARSALDAYGLGEAGFTVSAVSWEEAQAWADEACAGERRVAALCRPHEWLHGAGAGGPGLRVLEDPKHALGGEREARLLIGHDVAESLDPDLLDELDELTLGNKVVSAMAHAMRVAGMSAEQAADAWQRGKLTPRA